MENSFESLSIGEDTICTDYMTKVHKKLPTGTHDSIRSITLRNSHYETESLKSDIPWNVLFTGLRV